MKVPPFIKEVRRRSTLPQGHPCSTIDAERLNFRVRNGTGCFPLAMTAETLLRCQNLDRNLSIVILVPDRISGTTQWTRSNFVVKSSAY